MPTFGPSSRKRLDTCHPDLIRVMEKAIQVVDFSVLCGYRSEEEQERAFSMGRSTKQYPYSRHNQIPSQAVDIAPWPIDWRVDQDLWLLRHSSQKVAEPVLNNIKRWFATVYFIIGVGYSLGIHLETGADFNGNWSWSDENFVDLPHIQLRGN